MNNGAKNDKKCSLHNFEGKRGKVAKWPRDFGPLKPMSWRRSGGFSRGVWVQRNAQLRISRPRRCLLTKEGRVYKHSPSPFVNLQVVASCVRRGFKTIACMSLCRLFPEKLHRPLCPVLLLRAIRANRLKPAIRNVPRFAKGGFSSGTL